MYCLNEALNAPPGAKIKGLGRLARDGFGKAGNFNCLKIIKADLMPRRDTERTIWEVIRPRFNPAKPAPAFSIRGTEKMQLVKALLGKMQGSF